MYYSPAVPRPKFRDQYHRTPVVDSLLKQLGLSDSKREIQRESSPSWHARDAIIPLSPPNGLASGYSVVSSPGLYQSQQRARRQRPEIASPLSYSIPSEQVRRHDDGSSELQRTSRYILDELSATNRRLCSLGLHDSTIVSIEPLYGNNTSTRDVARSPTMRVQSPYGSPYAGEAHSAVAALSPPPPGIRSRPAVSESAQDAQGMGPTSSFASRKRPQGDHSQIELHEPALPWPGASSSVSGSSDSEELKSAGESALPVAPLPRSTVAQTDAQAQLAERDAYAPLSPLGHAPVESSGAASEALAVRRDISTLAQAMAGMDERLQRIEASLALASRAHGDRTAGGAGVGETKEKDREDCGEGDLDSGSFVGSGASSKSSLHAGGEREHSEPSSPDGPRQLRSAHDPDKYSRSRAERSLESYDRQAQAAEAPESEQLRRVALGPKHAAEGDKAEGRPAREAQPVHYHLPATAEALAGADVPREGEARTEGPAKASHDAGEGRSRRGSAGDVEDDNDVLDGTLGSLEPVVESSPPVAPPAALKPNPPDKEHADSDQCTDVDQAHALGRGRSGQDQREHGLHDRPDECDEQLELSAAQGYRGAAPESRSGAMDGSSPGGPWEGAMVNSYAAARDTGKVEGSPHQDKAVGSPHQDDEDSTRGRSSASAAGYSSLVEFAPTSADQPSSGPKPVDGQAHHSGGSSARAEEHEQIDSSAEVAPIGEDDHRQHHSSSDGGAPVETGHTSGESASIGQLHPAPVPTVSEAAHPQTRPEDDGSSGLASIPEVDEDQDGAYDGSTPAEEPGGGGGKAGAAGGAGPDAEEGPDSEAEGGRVYASVGAESIDAADDGNYAQDEAGDEDDSDDMFPPLLPARLRDLAGGVILIKHGSSGWPHRRKIFLDVFGALRSLELPLMIRWAEEDHQIDEQDPPDWSQFGEREAGPPRCINVLDLEAATRGMESPLMQRRGTAADASRYVGLKGKRRSLDLEAADEDEAQELYETFQDMCKCKDKLADIVRAIVRGEILIDDETGEGHFVGSQEVDEHRSGDHGEDGHGVVEGMHEDDSEGRRGAGGRVDGGPSDPGGPDDDDSDE